MPNSSITCNCDNCDLKSLFVNRVDTDKLSEMCNRKIEKNFHRGDSIFNEGEDIDEFIYLKTGLVKLFRKSKGGRDQIITIAKPLDFVSLLSVFSNNQYQYSVTAIEDSVTCSFDLVEIKHLIKTNGNFAMSIIEKLSMSSDNIINGSLELRQKNLRGRIAFILLYFAEHVYFKNEFNLPVSRREIGELISMTTENVIRTLSEFRKDKILRIYGKTIEIFNIEKLRQIERLG